MSDNITPAWKHSEPAEGAQEYYANHLQVFWTGVDLTLVFGKIQHSTESLDENVLNIENRVKVTMPWSVAKLVMTSLAGAVDQYEKKNEALKLPGEYKLP